MNQILITKFIKKSSKIKQYKIIFFISIITISIFIFINFLGKYQLEKEKNFSDSISKNYKVYKLFAEPENKSRNYKDSDILGNISIPKIKVNYPFFYGISDDLLKISPCRFNGEMPDKKSNLCIAGHNYNDDRFFSKLMKLDLNDLIIIEDNSKNKFFYYVYKKIEIEESKISSATNNINDYCVLTLVTCNNSNNKRIIIKAKLKA